MLMSPASPTNGRRASVPPDKLAERLTRQMADPASVAAVLARCDLAAISHPLPYAHAPNRRALRHDGSRQLRRGGEDAALDCTWGD